MGHGDSIMASSIAKRIHAMTNRSVTIVDLECKSLADEVWRGLPYIVDVAPGTMTLNSPGTRQYYAGMEGNRIIWRKWDIAPGEIRLTDEERAWAAERVVRPSILIEWRYKSKGGGGANKNWGKEKWDAVANALRHEVGIIEVSADDLFKEGNGLRFERPAGGVGHTMVYTPTFRHACAILERSIGYVGHEGGLHHAAAALGKRAVVVFGGYISPDITGYADHTNLYVADERYPLGCGTVTPCEHCRESMSKITVEQVVGAVREMVK